MTKIISVNKSEVHNVVKQSQEFIQLIEGIGVEGDAHSGKTVKHEYLVRKTPELENLRQVHFIAQEMLEEINRKGFNIQPGQMGENITTQNIDLVNLPQGTKLKLGKEAVVLITGLRMPCSNLNKVADGLLKAAMQFDKDRKPIPRCGIMSIVLKGGIVHKSDTIEVILPQGEFVPLEEV